MPTKARLVTKITDINSLVNRSWTEAELQEKLNRSGALLNKYKPIERNRLNNLYKDAKKTGDNERMEEITKELAALDGPKLAFSTSMQSSAKKTGPKELSQQERLHQLNQENRRKNAEEVRQAQINERRAAKAIEAALARGENVVEDHSRRVKTRAKFKHDVADMGKKVGSDANTPSVNTPIVGAKTDDTPLPYIALLEQRKNERKGLPTITRPIYDDDVIGALDLGIDVDIEI
jgi:RNA polymerase-associated protein RTF1